MSLSDGPPPIRSTSIAWKYFHVKDKDLRLATCKICQSVLSYRSTVANLLKHLKQKHKDNFRPQESSDEFEIGEKSNSSLSENEDDEETNDEISEKNKTVKVLESLETKPDEESVCLLCQMTFPDQSSDEMMKHMVKVHNISEIKLVDGNVLLEEKESQPVKKMKRSISWDFFTVIDNNSRTALCNLCNKELSYRSSVSNLIKHVKRKHHIRMTHRQEGSVTNGEEKQTYKPRSAVWSFFNYINDEKTVCACVHCHKEFNVADGLENMKKHLLEEHPEALLHHKTNGDPLFITVPNDEHKEEESGEENMQVEYLEFDELDRQVKKKPILQRKSNFQRSSSFEQRPSFSQSFNQKPRSGFERRPKQSIHRSPVRSQVEIPESLEHFSNYTMSLLQELPEKVSKRLQMNFVKQIIEAQISYSEETNCETEGGRKINSTVTGTAYNSKGAADNVVVNETATSTNSDVGSGAIKIANGIIIRPIVTTS